MIPFDLKKYQHIANTEAFTLADLDRLSQIEKDSDESRFIYCKESAINIGECVSHSFIPWREIRYIGTFIDDDPMTSLIIGIAGTDQIVQFDTVEARKVAVAWLVDCTKLYGKK